MAYQFPEHQLLITSNDSEGSDELGGLTSDELNRKEKQLKNYKVCDLLDSPSPGGHKGKSLGSSTSLVNIQN